MRRQAFAVAGGPNLAGQIAVWAAEPESSW
jgi:hypothetical protein